LTARSSVFGTGVLIGMGAGTVERWEAGAAMLP
jgi:hypothetical protein